MLPRSPGPRPRGSFPGTAPWKRPVNWKPSRSCVSGPGLRAMVLGQPWGSDRISAQPGGGRFHPHPCPPGSRLRAGAAPRSVRPTSGWVATPSDTIKRGRFPSHGRELVREMDRLGFILDATHLCDRTFHEVLDLYQGPIWASHSNCRMLVDDPRQFSDQQIKRLIERGAVIGGRPGCLDAGSGLDSSPEYSGRDRGGSGTGARSYRPHLPAGRKCESCGNRFGPRRRIRHRTDCQGSELHCRPGEAGGAIGEAQLRPGHHRPDPPPQFHPVPA